MIVDRDGKKLDELPSGTQGFMTLTRLLDILETHDCNHREEIKAIEFKASGIRFTVGYREI